MATRPRGALGVLCGQRLLRTAALLLLALPLTAAGCTAFKRCAYEGSDRDEWQQPARVVQALDLRPGSRVADLGSGSGYFTLRLAEAVGPDGIVYAVDVDEGMNAYLAEKARQAGHENVRVILAAVDDPRLPPADVDLIFVSNTYHHLRERAAYFRNARRYLRSGGRVAIVEYAGRGWFSRWLGHHTSPETIESEMRAAGFEPVARLDFLPRQSFLIFDTDDPAAPDPSARPRD